MENTNSIISELREQIIALPVSRSGKRMGITPELRMTVVATQRLSGLSGEEFCKEIGISYSCFSKWKREKKGKIQLEKSMGFQKVKIEQEKPPCENAKFILEGPQGLRVIVTSVSEVAAIWRALC